MKKSISSLADLGAKNLGKTFQGPLRAVNTWSLGKRGPSLHRVHHPSTTYNQVPVLFSYCYRLSYELASRTHSQSTLHCFDGPLLLLLFISAAPALYPRVQALSPG